MISFKEYLTELEAFHTTYSEWGAMTDRGRVVSGNDHPTATIHSALGDHNIHFAQEDAHSGGPHRDSSFGNFQKGSPKGRTLNIRTHGPKALKTALKHFDKFPHIESRKVLWDHYRGAGEVGVPHSTSGDSGVVYHDMLDHHSESSKKKSSVKESVEKIGRGAGGECFRNCFKHINTDFDQDLSVVHGQAKDKKGKMIDHAWVESKTHVIDPTVGVKTTKEHYYKETNAMAHHTYTPKQTRRLSVKTGNYGPWTDDERKTEATT